MESPDYERWSPYPIGAISSPARTADGDATDESLADRAGTDVSYLPIPASDEYYDVAEGTRRPLATAQVVSADRPLLSALEVLIDHPFVLVVDEGADPTYGVVTAADLNRRTAEAAFYPALSTLADRLAGVIEREYPDPETLVPLVGPFPVGAWTKARSNDVDVHVAEFLTLSDMVGVLKGNDRLLSTLGYDDPDEFESDLYGVGDLRNRVMHGNRSLVLDADDVEATHDRFRTAVELIDRIEADSPARQSRFSPW